MKKLICFITVFVCIPSFAASLRLVDGSGDIFLRQNKSALSLSSRSGELVVVVNQCNKKLIHAFWQSVELQFSHLPKILGLPKEDVAYATLDGQVALLPVFDPENVLFFNQLPNKFLVLSTKAAKKCP